MKKSNPLIGLSCIVLVFVIFVSSVGLFWMDAGAPADFITAHGDTVQLYGRGLYRYDSMLSATTNRGTDAVILFVSVPFFVYALFSYGRGSLRGGMLLIGMLTLYLYYSASLAFGVAYNPLFLAYVVLFSLCLCTYFFALRQVDFSSLSDHFLPNMPHKAMGIFLIVAGSATALVWLSDIVGGLLTGKMPAALSSNSTLITYVFDLGIIFPATVISGSLVLHRKAIGYPFASAMIILCAFIGLVVIGQTAMQMLAGVFLSPGQLFGFVGTFVVLSAIAMTIVVRFFRALSETPVA